MQIEKSTLDFLKSLKRNNNREWFQNNKDRYLEAQSNIISWVDALIQKMSTHDDLQTENGKESLYRIYNDVRFFKDKTPYNPRFAGYLKRSKPQLRGGYYFWIVPGATHIGCGFAYPNPDDLKRLRQDIASNYHVWKKLLTKKSITSVFGAMQGDQVKTAPKGYPQDHPAITLLRYKQFWFERAFTDADVLSPRFVNEVNHSYRAIRPLFDHMSEVLTTNENGESILR
ncbi:MAG: DUF2461 domain-containing protein [Bacteroidota bacterium]|jgi:uncharacterized protein (TIGR02453 family)|nr:DUF2461 domain-containing protein [Cytophagales bacterium]MCE2956125.1 DUF2461 domain-containing protein [Flammeovirgaceae bacterium]